MDWNHFALLADLIVVKLHLDIFTIYKFWTYRELLQSTQNYSDAERLNTSVLNCSIADIGKSMS